MALITWGRKHSVGVKVLDDQHKVLIESLNEFHAAMIKGQAQTVAAPLLEKLVKHARDHFSDEERMMQTTNYPGLPQHRALHQDITRRVGEYQQLAKRGDSTMYLPLLHFMRDWLNDHLTQEDQKYSSWLNEHGIS